MCGITIWNIPFVANDTLADEIWNNVPDIELLNKANVFNLSPIFLWSFDSCLLIQTWYTIARNRGLPVATVTVEWGPSLVDYIRKLYQSYSLHYWSFASISDIFPQWSVIDERSCLSDYILCSSSVIMSRIWRDLTYAAANQKSCFQDEVQ